jgi:glycosyltransferase involved in cell wall biosynthesis
VLLAAEKLTDLPQLRISFVGDGPDKKRLQRMAEELRLTNVCFREPMPKEAMPTLVAEADMCLAPLKTYIPGAVPSKIYEAMACGRPVVFVGEGEAAEIVGQNRAGLIVRPGDVDGLAASLRQLTEDGELRQRLGESGRRAAETKFDRAVIFSRFEKELLGE